METVIRFVHWTGGWDGLGTVTGGDDCADGDAFTFPGALRKSIDCMRDEDGDGYGSQTYLGRLS